MIWYDIRYDSLYHMIYVSDIIYDMMYNVAVVDSEGPVSSFVKNKTRWPPQTYFEQSRTPPPIGQIMDLPVYGMVWYVFLSYLNIPSFSNNYDNVTTSYICLHPPLDFKCVAIVFPKLTNICHTNRRTFHFNVRLVYLLLTLTIAVRATRSLSMGNSYTQCTINSQYLK